MYNYLRSGITFIVLLIIVSGCQHAELFTTYDISLHEAITPKQVKEKYGEQKIFTKDSVGIKKYYFENDMVKILWMPGKTSVSFSMMNKTENSIKILWDDASYVDVAGAGHRIMHSGVKYNEKNAAQPASIVPRKGTFDDIMVPTDNVYFNSYTGWEELPLFPATGETEVAVTEKAKSIYVGKTFQMLLPLSIQDVVNEYTFIFNIDSVSVEKKMVHGI